MAAEKGWEWGVARGGCPLCSAGRMCQNAGLGDFPGGPVVKTLCSALLMQGAQI